LHYNSNVNPNEPGSEIDRLEKSLADLVAESRRLEAEVEAIKSERFVKPPQNRGLFASAEIVPVESLP
jgi:hypothetical protein